MAGQTAGHCAGETAGDRKPADQATGDGAGNANSTDGDTGAGDGAGNTNPSDGDAGAGNAGSTTGDAGAGNTGPTTGDRAGNQIPQTDAPQTETENQQPSRPEKPRLNETSLKMTRKRTYQLKLKGAQGKVRWKSSNSSVVSVSENGRIKAKKAGTCVITAKCAGKKYRCDVRVYESSKEWRPGAILDMYRPKKDKGKVILAGSSYMERWDTAEKALEPFEVLNMGIAGSKADDWIRLYQKLLVPYKPKAIVLCTGDNNMNAGPDSESGSATAQKVIYLLKQLQKELPDTEIYYVSVAPNPRRWKVWSQMKECNRTVEQYCKTKKRLHFIDMTPHLLKKGALQKKLYCSDRLHLNKKGYKIWGEVIGNRLRQDMQILLRQ